MGFVSRRGLKGTRLQSQDAVSREWAFRSFKALEAIPKEKTQQYKIKYIQADERITGILKKKKKTAMKKSEEEKEERQCG